MEKWDDCETALARMAAAAQKQLEGYGKPELREEIKTLVKRALGRGTALRDPVFWPAGMLALGLEEYAGRLTRRTEREGAAKTEEEGRGDGTGKTVGSQKPDVRQEALDADKAVCNFLKKWITGGAKVTYVDDALSGYVLLRRYERMAESGLHGGNTGDGAMEMEPEAYRQAARRIAAQMKAAPRDQAGAIVYRAGRGNEYIFADGAGMTAMFLSRYGALFDDREATELAVTQLRSFLRCGMDRRSGLPYHGYELTDKVKYGLVGWGRAVGWLLMGLVVTVTSLPETHGAYEELKRGYSRLVLATEQWQREDGMYAWQLGAAEGPADTSATAMISYAAAVGVRADILGEEHRIRLNQSIKALLEMTGQDGRVQGALAECMGFAEHPQTYGCYPWGQGAALAFLSAMR
ncbi:MAG: glycoside hydrolase family 88 protein [Eubacteriales bacterium]|nr:glycoside hydrolase family 88 protein [Eubacteriales bacterium]